MRGTPDPLEVELEAALEYRQLTSALVCTHQGVGHRHHAWMVRAVGGNRGLEGLFSATKDDVADNELGLHVPIVTELLSAQQRWGSLGLGLDRDETHVEVVVIVDSHCGRRA